MRNTWRKQKTTSDSDKQYRLTNVLWWTNQENVMKEVAVLMDLAYVDTNTPGWFKHCTAAAKSIIDNMPEVEKRELQMKAQELAEKGFPPELQRNWVFPVVAGRIAGFAGSAEIKKNRIAEEKWYTRFHKTTKQNYKEMGLVSISIVGFTTKNAQLAIDM